MNKLFFIWIMSGLFNHVFLSLECITVNAQIHVISYLHVMQVCNENLLT